jgi:hypothetical protein
VPEVASAPVTVGATRSRTWAILAHLLQLRALSTVPRHALAQDAPLRKGAERNMQRTIRPFVLSLGLLLSCADGDAPKNTIEAPTSVPSEADAAMSVTHCDARAIQDKALKLAQEAAACQDDSECALTEIDGACLSAFLCSVPVNKNADLIRLRAEAARLSAEYKQCPGFSCPMASCAGPFGAKCDQSTQFCKWVKL